MSQPAANDIEKELTRDISQFYDDPYGYVLYAFPWGMPGTDLEDYEGPDKWQAEQLLRVREKIQEDPEGFQLQEAVASGHGVGKAQSYHALTPTPQGIRRWGDLQSGDLLFDSDGAPVRIKQTHHCCNIPMYRVTFDDGSQIDVSSGHLWSVRGRRERRRSLDGWRTMETIELLAGVKRYNGTSQARQWEIPIQGPAQFEEREVDIHPYLMGVWLGDGSKGKPSYSKPYPEVADRIRSLGYTVTDCKDGVQHRIKNITHLLGDPVFERGSHERYIPDEYKFNTAANRMELFRGLCDTDGEAHHTGSIVYSSTSQQLAEDVIWLARSLGFKAKMRSSVKHGWYPDGEGGRVECRDCYRVSINAPVNPFSIDHKRNTYKPSESRYLKRWIDSIEYIGNNNGMCVTVDADDGLYQAGDFIVTHNSAEVSWIILWAMSTRPHLAGWVTANTQTQLKSKTWRELSVWHKRAINRHWFEWTATRFYQVNHPETWGIDAIPWSENNSEAFAGLHSDHVLMIMDEASAIANIIWEVSEGAMTTPKAMWFVYGNPTRNTGRFRECFGKYRHRWSVQQVDSREAKMTDKEKIAQWIADEGEDSDFVRVRVRGEFPRAGTKQLISAEPVHEARKADMPIDEYILHPIVLGVDVARYGMDESVITVRQGRKQIQQKIHRGMDNIQLAQRAAEMYREFGKVRTIFVDGVGTGSGVVDHLKNTGYPVVDVNAGQNANDRRLFYNKRAEMWFRMKEWLESGADILDDAELDEQLTGVEYDYTPKEQIRLEKKEDMRERGLSSPDRAEALALTFAEIVHIGQAQDSFEPDFEV